MLYTELTKLWHHSSSLHSPNIIHTAVGKLLRTSGGAPVGLSPQWVGHMSSGFPGSTGVRGYGMYRWLDWVFE